MTISPSPARADDRWFRWLALALAAGHLAFAAATAGVRPEHVVADALIGGLPFVGPRAAHFVRLALPVWFTGAVFDTQRLWLPLRGEVHTGTLWDLEASLFPGPGGAPWPAFFWGHHHASLDLLAGATYATYLVEYFGLAVLFFRREPARFSRFAWSLLLVNFVALAVYALYPAAPPWYVITHGPGPADLSAAGSAAGAARFDALVGVPIFERFYARSPNVFGAMPSLHVTYPVLASLLTWDLGKRYRVPTVVFALLMGFSAVYLTHHYVLDVVAGASVALVTGLVVTGAARWLAAGPTAATATGVEGARGNA